MKKVVRIIPDPHLRFGFAHEIDLCCCYSTVLCASSFDADLNANLFSVLLDRLWSLWFGALDFFLKKNEKTEENFHFSCMSQSYIYQVLQTIQMKLILLCVWAEPAVLGSAKTALKFIYKI